MNVLLETTGGVLQARNTQNPIGYGGLVSQNRSSATSFYGFDTQQSTRILVSVAGVITDSLSFKAFGEELQSGAGTVNPFWFGGQVGYFRDLPGVMNVGRRKLIAANGVFLNRDPIGFAGGDANLYRFVGNNPVGRVDPSGTITYEPYNDQAWAAGKCTVGPPKSLNCCGFGNAFWHFSFTTGKHVPNPDCDGVLVQRNVRSSSGKYCAQPQKDWKFQPDLTYYEYWNVGENQDYTKYFDHSARCGGNTCSGVLNGNWKVSKTSKFYCFGADAIKWLDERLGGFIVHNPLCLGASGSLPCTTDLDGKVAARFDNEDVAKSQEQGAQTGTGDWTCCPPLPCESAGLYTSNVKYTNQPKLAQPCATCNQAM